MRFLYVTRKEIACNCGCGQDTFDVELSEVLDEIRKHFGCRLYVSSGNRCIEYNEKVQLEKDSDYTPYSSESTHLISKAADIQVENISPAVVYKYLANKFPNKFGIGSYASFTHIDVRPIKARW